MWQWLISLGLSLLSAWLTPDNYYEGFVHGALVVGGIWLGVWLVKETKLSGGQLVALAALGLIAYYYFTRDVPPNSVPLVPTPDSKPWNPFKPKPKEPDCPNCPQATSLQFGGFDKGGAISPDGKVQVECDLPPEWRMKNVGGRDGAGLCVFTSIMHAARYQQEMRLWNFQKDMKQEPGGGYPQKVDKMIEKYGKGTNYIQHEGGDVKFLELALHTGRFPSVTYSGKDGVYYQSSVAHMVNLAYLDNERAAIFDNNYIDGYLWMTRAEFLERWKGMGGGWAVVLLTPPPPQPIRVTVSVPAAPVHRQTELHSKLPPIAAVRF